MWLADGSALNSPLASLVLLPSLDNRHQVAVGIADHGLFFKKDRQSSTASGVAAWLLELTAKRCPAVMGCPVILLLPL